MDGSELGYKRSRSNTAQRKITLIGNHNVALAVKACLFCCKFGRSSIREMTTMCNRLWRAIQKSLRATAVIVLAATGAAAGSGARPADTVKIGFSMPLTGPLASNGRAILTAYQM